MNAGIANSGGFIGQVQGVVQWTSSENHAGTSQRSESAPSAHEPAKRRS